MNQLIICTVQEYDGEFMTAVDYNDPDAVFYSVMMGGNNGEIKNQNYPDIGQKILIGVDDEGIFHYLHALYDEENPRPFEDTKIKGWKHGDTEFKYDPTSGKLDIVIDGKIAIGNGNKETYTILIAMMQTLISGQVLTADGPANFTAATIAEFNQHKADLETIGG
jgi:hypothetical protein